MPEQRQPDERADPRPERPEQEGHQQDGGQQERSEQERPQQDGPPSKKARHDVRRQDLRRQDLRKQGNRERDEQGRARNARPRDALGRPLPRGMVGVERVPEDLVLPPRESLEQAQRLLDTGRPFHAHEVLEATWKAAPESERDLWQGLAQLAVGLTHVLRGNPTGAATLLQRADRRLARYAGDPPYGVDVAGLHAWTDALLADLARDGPVPTPASPKVVREDRFPV